MAGSQPSKTLFGARSPRPSRPAARRGCAALALACLLGWSSSARAQPLPKISPGPLSTPHARWDDAGQGCVQCHALTGGLSGEKCLACHAHAGLRESLAARRGLHAGFDKPCFACHTEHKGRDGAVADWRQVGEGRQFDHARTGFALAGMHDEVKCTACHEQRSKSGPIRFAGLDPSCDGCHQNPHRFRAQRLRENCRLCHAAGGVRPKQLTAAQVPFDHGETTGVKLAGKHATVTCGSCHKDGVMSVGASPRSCGSCHKPKHGKAFPDRCTDCHDPARPFANVQYEHAFTGFALEGGHARADCRSCHDPKSRKKPSADCASCHKATHKDRFAGRACAQCHPRNGGLKTIEFDHGKQTRFALSGRHDEAQCRDCHRGKTPAKFERFASAECRDCHQHKNAHKGQLMDKPCTSCHANGGRRLDFDHDKESRFPLTGLHADVAQRKKGCASCHPKGSFRTGKTACADCHKDSHQGRLGNQCERCHTPQVRFAQAQTSFDHDRASAFKLEGLHEKVACAKCHPQRDYKTGKSRCVECHKDTDPHQGRLGDRCETCHQPQKGAPLFDHRKMTGFALTGHHESLECRFCHHAPTGDGPRKVGWTRSASPALDRRFPVLGDACAGCHEDEHQGRNGEACERCHETRSFKGVNANYHDTGPFRLQGAHSTLACESCHGGRKQVAGTGELCGQCHRDDDPHRNALGPTCGDCHAQNAWRPARFSHLETGFPLRGAHRTAACEDCHGPGTFQGLATDCEACHAAQASRPVDPLHTAELRPCDRCHSEVGFVPARNSHSAFELRGQHRFIGCRSCHNAGTYAGTPDACESCHLSSYLDPRAEPAHRGSTSTACGDCHTPVGWRPARNP